MSGDKKRSPDDADVCSLVGLVYAYGDAVLLPISGTCCSRWMSSLEGLRLALRARSSSLVGGVKFPRGFSESDTTTNRLSYSLIYSGASWMIGS